jgi:hypothetical protein
MYDMRKSLTSIRYVVSQFYPIANSLRPPGPLYSLLKSPRFLEILDDILDT